MKRRLDTGAKTESKKTVRVSLSVLAHGSKGLFRDLVGQLLSGCYSFPHLQTEEQTHCVDTPDFI